MTSSQMAENFKSGSIFPIASKMVFEFNELGIQSNEVLNKHEFASYLLGYLAGKIASKKFKNAETYEFMNELLFQENNKKPYLFKKSLMKKSFINDMEDLQEDDKSIYAALILEEFPNDEADSVKVLAAFFNQRSSK